MKLPNNLSFRRDLAAMSDRRRIFEKWLLSQFNLEITPFCFDQNNGYADEQVHAMWIGYNVGIEFTNERLVS